MGSSIRIDTIGKKPLRVLPRLNEDINEEWINDKSRFAIDGLSSQRIDRPYLKIDDKLSISDWNTVLEKIIKEISIRDQSKTLALSGKFTDIETFYSSKVLWISRTFI